MTKNEALKIVYHCAAQYEKELSGKNLLFIYRDKQKQVYSLEVYFTAANFLHLTGFQVRSQEITPKNFLQKCIDKRLTLNDFEFSQNGTTPLKLQVLPILMTKDLSANILGIFNNEEALLYTDKIVGNIRGCIGFIPVNNGNYVPNTVLNGDIRNFSNNPYQILLTYRKRNTERHYYEIVHYAKGIRWREFCLPDQYSYLPLPEQYV